MRVLNVTGGISANAGEQTARRLEHYFSGCEITCGIFESANPAFDSFAADRDIETTYFGPSVTDRFESLSLLPGRGYPNAAVHAVRNRSEFDLVHVYGGPLFHGPMGAVHAAASRSPLIVRFNGYVPLPDSTLKRAVVRTVVSGLLRNTRVVFNSHAQKSDTLSAYGVNDGEHIEVISPGVDERWFGPVEAADERATELGIDPETNVVGSVITPRPVKRLDRAFEVVSTLAERRDMAYVVLGESDQLDRYKRLAGDMGISDEVYWAGHRGQAELAEWYSTFDATILTSEWESFGMSITESYLCGTPCVTFDVGGMSDQIVDGDTGYLVEPYDLDEFATALEDLLADEEQADEFGAQGMEYVTERFTLDTVSDKYREMIDAIT